MRTAVFALALLAGCGGASGAAPGAALSPSYATSLGSTSASMPSRLPAPALPSRASVQTDLVVRPDVLVLGFALQETDADPQRALTAAKASVEDLERQFKEATGGASTVRMLGASFTTVFTEKAESEGDAVSAAVDGVIEVRLAPELDFWARSRLAAAVAQVRREVSAAVQAAKDGRRGATFGQPRAEVKEPEGHRAQLTEQWLRRARSFAEAAQAASAPLLLVDCAPPGAIEQRPISLLEVGLSLSVACRLNALSAEPKRD
ncbi:hypothetical protein WMF27_09235 [Sorangium sp. So ce281]|uniref:hypothetical protein n=1 Tax=unclassified Sorangium TaxID=2621164 RepID=UPI003F5E461D